jgi:hypothetical protein
MGSNSVHGTVKGPFAVGVKQFRLYRAGQYGLPWTDRHDVDKGNRVAIAIGLLS